MVTVVSLLLYLLLLFLLYTCCSVLWCCGGGGLIGWFRVSSSVYNATKSTPSIYSHFRLVFISLTNTVGFHKFKGVFFVVCFFQFSFIIFALY